MRSKTWKWYQTPSTAAISSSGHLRYCMPRPPLILFDVTAPPHIHPVVGTNHAERDGTVPLVQYNVEEAIFCMPQ